MGLILETINIFLLGVIGGATPGPILASSFTESLRKGFIGSFRIIFMAMVSEIMVALSVLVIFFTFSIPQIIFSLISLAGVLVLIWLASQIWKINKFNEGGEIFTFKKIFLLTILNGPFWIFWITICVPQAFLLKQKIAGGQYLFLILFELGWLFSTVFLTFIFSRFKPLLIKGRLIGLTLKILALILIYFAIRLAINSISLSELFG